MATRQDAKDQKSMAGMEFPVEAAIRASADANERLLNARRNERVARSQNPVNDEVLDAAVLERLSAEKAYRDAVRAEAQARAARAAARARK